ncbi:MAG: haloacid dehalogenase-like hydrolase [Candidatus Eisenbacteria bacterium]|nr:haloacid dehalogenase-like hydrolase [Candidatus Eisenbacteria bacterium]
MSSVGAPTRAALFDIDGTLLHGHGSGRRAFLRALEEIHRRPIDDAGFSFAGRTDVEILKKVLAQNDLPDPTPEEILHFATLYCRHLEHELSLLDGPLLYPGAERLVAAVCARPDWAPGLLTGNLREGARRKLASTGLWERFTFGAFGDDHEDRNALVPIALRRALEVHSAAIPPGRAVVIGDTERDVACARAGGAKVIAVRNGWDDGVALRRAEPDAYFEDLTDTGALLAALESLTAD